MGPRKIHADPICHKFSASCNLQTFLLITCSSRCYDDLLFATILSCLFYACHRSGKLVQKNSKDLFDWQKIIKHSSLKFSQGRAQYHPPYHKGDPFYCGTDILFLQQEVADTITLLQEYVDECDSIHNVCLALFLQEDGSHPTRSWFDALFFAVLNWEFGGHSPHAGGATFYASLSLSEDVIQALVWGPLKHGKST